MTTALAAQLENAELNADVRCVVLTGAGKGFCAGGDVKGMAARSDDVETTGGAAKDTIDEAVHRQRLAQRATAGRLYNMPKLRHVVQPAGGSPLGKALTVHGFIDGVLSCTAGGFYIITARRHTLDVATGAKPFACSGKHHTTHIGVQFRIFQLCCQCSGHFAR